MESIRPVRPFTGEDQATVTALKAVYESLLTPPATAYAPLAASVAAVWSTGPNNGVDRVSSLPDQILRNIVSRLPTKDVVRTGALTSRWRASGTRRPSSSPTPVSSRGARRSRPGGRPSRTRSASAT
jgi:hypothetical protein